MPEIDALFESINVRDLLAGHDLNDPTTPLSAPDLRLLINRLQSHSLRIKSKVQSYLVAHHSEFSDLFSTCQDAVSRTRLISDDVSDVVELVSDRPVDVEIRKVVDEITEKTKEVRLKRESLELVSAIVGICEAVEETKVALRGGRFRFAAERVRELKGVLRVGEEEEGGEPVAYALLRKEWSDCFDEIQEVLARFMESAVRFELESCKLRISYQLSVGETTGIALTTVLEAMEVIGMLDYGLAKAADSIFKHVITPAVTHASTFNAVEDSCKTSGDITEATLQLDQSSDHKTEDVDGEAIYSGILKVVKFICSSLCFGNVTWIHSFGRLTWPRISELIISKFLSKVVPEDASKLADFQKVIERTSQFETALKELNFVSPSDAEGRLSKYAENVEVHFASRKKIEILAKARSLMLQCNFTIPKGLAMRNASFKSGGAESLDEDSSKHIVRLLFSSEVCMVSEAASQLMHLVHKTLEDVCVSSARVATECYHAARDSILLYEAVVPVKLEKQLNGINQAAALLHNDCLYLFEEILGLAFEYRASFPSSIKEHAVFADVAPSHPPPYYSKPICSSQSSLIRIPINKGCCFGRSSNLITSLHAAPRGETRRTSGVQWCNRSIRCDPFKVNDKNSRTVTVRSDLSGAATPESTYPEPEIKLSSRLRGICFCLVAGVSAIVLIVLMIIGHPFVLLFDRYRRKFHHFIAKLWASISIYPFYKTDIQGLENLPSSDTPCVYVSNHQSFLDIYTLLSLGQSYKFISKTGIFVIPVIGWAMSMMGVVPLKRMDPRSQVDCLKRCMELVKKGASVFFFPEGTRSKDGRLGPFKKGAFTVAAKTGVPVVPITLMGTGKIMPTGSEGILNHGDVRVIIHKPIYGSKADALCDEARNKIAESMNLLS